MIAYREFRFFHLEEESKILFDQMLEWVGPITNVKKFRLKKKKKTCGVHYSISSRLCLVAPYAFSPSNVGSPVFQ